jgi:hypothetical protein
METAQQAVVEVALTHGLMLELQAVPAVAHKVTAL